MTPEFAEKCLTGKTIKSIRWHEYLGWPMCIDEIEFTDGTVVMFSGNADYARIETVVFKTGEYEDIDSQE